MEDPVQYTSVTHSAAPFVSPFFISYPILTSSVSYYSTNARQHGIYLLNVSSRKLVMSRACPYFRQCVVPSLQLQTASLFSPCSVSVQEQPLLDVYSLASFTAWSCQLRQTGLLRGLSATSSWLWVTLFYLYWPTSSETGDIWCLQSRYQAFYCSFSGGKLFLL